MEMLFEAFFVDTRVDFIPVIRCYCHPTIILTLLGGSIGATGSVITTGMTFRAIAGVSVWHPHPDGTTISPFYG
jgi:hypothetical protein